MLILQCDASKDAMGAALLQEDRPLAFASASFSDSQKQYSQIEKELLSVYYGCKKFEYLLSGHTFVVQTDHQPLLPLVKKPLSDISPRLQRLVMKLIAFDFKLQYKPGKYLIVADTLSRDTHPMDELPTPFLEDKRMVKMVRVNISDEKLVAMQKDTREDPALNQLPPPQKLNIRSATVQRWASHPQPRYSGQVKRPILTRGKARLHPLGLHQNHPEGPGFQVHVVQAMIIMVNKIFSNLNLSLSLSLSRTARRMLERPRLATVPISRHLRRWAPVVDVPSTSLAFSSLHRCSFGGHAADIALRLALHALPHPKHLASSQPVCIACGSSNLSLAHRYWSCSASWIFAVDLEDHAITISSAAKHAIFVDREMRGIAGDPLAIFHQTRQRWQRRHVHSHDNHDINIENKLRALHSDAAVCAERRETNHLPLDFT
ncbi:K02A2.6-like [Cordylochernes scorpioides]|uniref:K02A2.6-like n=1 Tax=Cordylochernes scorpioides TaxID=51811 RepID=A0ABY6KJ48_9ARAC|nr:K02A2.6-like [Cordylochernes scorpioides]